jgi:hypothetical protein
MAKPSLFPAALTVDQAEIVRLRGQIEDLLYTIEEFEQRLAESEHDAAVNEFEQARSFPLLVKRMIEISKLKEWDGAGSRQPSAATTDNAWKVLRAIDEAAPPGWSGRAPQVAALGPAGYQFEWVGHGRELFIACNDDGTMDFLEVHSGHADREYAGTANDLTAALRRFTTG